MTEPDHSKDSKIEMTKKLLRSYRVLKTACEVSVYDSARGITEQDLVRELMAMRAPSRIESVAYSVQRTVTLLTHIDSCLLAFKTLCGREGKARQWRVIEGLYIADNRISAATIAEMEHISERVVYTDVSAAVSTLSLLFFGPDIEI